MNVNIEINFPQDAKTFYDKINVCVRQAKALEIASEKASVSDMILILDSWSIIYGLFKNILGESFVEAYDEMEV